MQKILIKINDLISNSPAKYDKIVYFSLLLALLSNIIIWLMILITFWNFKEYIILGYNVYFGISSFGVWYKLLLVPLLGLLIILINNLLAFQIYLEYSILAKFLSVMTIIINFILIIFISLIIYLNLYY